MTDTFRLTFTIGYIRLDLQSVLRKITRIVDISHGYQNLAC